MLLSALNPELEVDDEMVLLYYSRGGNGKTKVSNNNIWIKGEPVEAVLNVERFRLWLT